MAVPNIFGSATSAIPLSQLDTNFATPVTIGNTAVQLGNTVTSFGNVTLTNVTISSGNVTVSAGSNTAPSITTVGDTNTGIFFPTADTIAFTEGGVESMRINSSGNVGIGTTTPVSILDVAGTTPVLTIKDTQSKSWVTGDTVGDLNFYSSDTSGTGPRTVARIRSFADATATTVAGALSFWTSLQDAAATEKMRLTKEGNLGIGTSSPSKELDVAGEARANSFTVDGASDRYIYITSSDGLGECELRLGDAADTDAGSIAYNNATNSMQFRANAAERMRIDSVGNVQVQDGAVMPYAPAPAAISGAATLTNANIQAQIISATGTTYTITMPLGTTLETLATWATTNIAYDFYIINDASGTITLDATEVGVTSVGTMTIATGVSAQFRIRRTAANTFVVYRLG